MTEIRQATPADFHEIAELLNAAYSLIPRVNLQETAATVRKRASTALVMVAEADGRIVGTITAASSNSSESKLAGPGQIELTRLAVAPHMQGQGIGTAIALHSIEWARKRGIRALVGRSLNSMIEAHGLYEKCGATPHPIPSDRAITYVLDLNASKDR